ncbi:unnamed protein product [Heligmosomoides polygyrus]|uniref:DOMON domain-containing protein n=1 Tax=Heligmosomoides polygyrus TaxID=6339 RepID=A0A183F7Q0_HELPZ|nr:unnamed protein product [Heligmosomoides polygyrus]
MASTMTSALVLLIIFSVISSTVAGPCTFREGSYQVIYGIRNGIVHFRVILRGVPHMASGWTGIGFGRSMIEGLDTIVVRVANGRVNVSDEYVRGYTTSFPDKVSLLAKRNTRSRSQINDYNMVRERVHNQFFRGSSSFLEKHC